MMRRLITVTLTLSIGLFMVFNGNAAAIQVSPYGTPSAPILYTPPDPNNFIGEQIEYNEAAGPWVKQVVFQPWPNQNSNIIWIGQNLQVSGAIPWTGWYEEILISDWIFLNDGQNNISILGPFPPTGIPPGLSISLALDGRSFQLNFDPIAPDLDPFWPTVLCINFPLSYIGTTPFSGYPTFEFKAYPIASTATVPEPATMLLLGSGLLGLWGLRRKFKK